jgi:hypothetical protein
MRTGHVPEAGAGGKGCGIDPRDAAVFMARIDLAGKAPTLHPDYRKRSHLEASPRGIGFSDVEIHAGCNRGVSGFHWDTRDGADVVVAAVA